MIVLFDTSTLTYLLKPDAPGPYIAGSDERLPDCDSRISYLLSELQKAKATIIIPTPVISELLVLAGNAAAEWLQNLTGSRYFRLSPFDLLAAVECAEMAKLRLGVRLSRAAKAKAKFDEQIVAIARIERAEVIYSDDGDIAALVGNDETVTVRGMADMPLPPSKAQGSLNLELAPPQASGPPEDD